MNVHDVNVEFCSRSDTNLFFRKFTENWEARRLRIKNVLRAERGLSVLEKYAVEEGKTGGWRIVYTEENHDFYCSPVTASVQDVKAWGV